MALSSRAKTASQAAILAYTDVFAYLAIAAFCVVPVALLFKSTKVKADAGAPAH